MFSPYCKKGKGKRKTAVRSSPRTKGRVERGGNLKTPKKERALVTLRCRLEREEKKNTRGGEEEEKKKDFRELTRREEGTGGEIRKKSGPLGRFLRRREREVFRHVLRRRNKKLTPSDLREGEEKKKRQALGEKQDWQVATYCWTKEGCLFSERERDWELLTVGKGN